MKKVYMPALFLLAMSMLLSCDSDKTNEVDAAMRHFAVQLAGQNPDSIAGLYAVNGEIAGEGQRRVIGKDSIRKMFSSYTGFSVLKYTIIPSLTTMTGDSAQQDGSYRQIVVIPAGDTLNLKGDYKAILVKENGNWLIRRMYTYNYGKF